MMMNFLTNDYESFEISLSFKILDNLPFEMIIGRDDIDKYDLWAKTKHYRNVKSVQTLVQPTK